MTGVLTNIQEDGQLHTLLLAGATNERNRLQIERLLNEPASTEYLASVLKMPLESIMNLPKQLRHDSTQLDQDLSNLALTRYPALLQSHQATVAMNDSFSSLAGSLDHLLEATAQLETVAHQFERDVTSVRQSRERILKIQDRINEVEQLLETPQVVESCVRSGLWGEAIDVSLRLDELYAALTRSAPTMSRTASQQQREKLETRGAVLVVNKVRARIANSLLALRARVLDQLLSRDLKLPSAVRCISTLRRMNELDANKALTEPALRIAFLSARWTCLKHELEPIQGHLVACGVRIGQLVLDPLTGTDEEAEERSRWLKRWIEVWREIVGETISMFSDVFLASQAASSLYPLDLFLSTALSLLTSLLGSALPATHSAAALSSLLTQLTYCAHSFARYGLDFRLQLELDRRFETRIKELVANEWKQSVQTLASSVASLRSKSLVGSLVLAEVLSAIAHGGVEPLSPWSPQPPGVLSYLPPIAAFINSHANALNALRLLPARSLYEPLSVEQRQVLDDASNELVELGTHWNNKYGASDDREAERSILVWLLRAWQLWVVPWCVGALENVYAQVDVTEQQGQRKAQGLPALKTVKETLALLEGLKESPSEQTEREEEADPNATNEGKTNGHDLPVMTEG